MPPKYSWVIPIYNEATSLPSLLSGINATMKRRPHEIIAVNDASTDDSQTVLRRLTSTYPHLKIITLPSHQGKWPALTTGLRQTHGRLIITLDADLQDDPRDLPKLLHFFDQGYHLVSGYRRHRFDPWYKILISHFGNLLVSALTHHRFFDLNSPFKVYSRQLLNSLPLTGSLFRFSLLFAYRLGFKTIEVPIRHRPRRYGASKFGLIKYLRIIYDLILVLLLFSGSGRVRRASGHIRKTK